MMNGRSGSRGARAVLAVALGVAAAVAGEAVIAKTNDSISISGLTCAAPGNNVTLIASGGGGLYSWTFASNKSKGTLRPSSANVTYTAGPKPAKDVIQVSDSRGLTRKASIVVRALTVSPQSKKVRRGGSIRFKAGGGSCDYAWTLPKNSSGGKVDADGTYTAGRALGPDVVKVTDSLGNAATANVMVK
ncbi:MAG: hypothetical protein NTX64_07025 [Elusimicrobia bacterium]|nr:hypothetical protein [Elusimicrobiota bacterium]